MGVSHLLFLVEEYSCEVFMRGFLPRVLPEGVSFGIFTFRGKSDLRKQLPNRLRAYSKWLPADHRIFVVCDRDQDSCVQLKAELDLVARNAGLAPKGSEADGAMWRVVNRIAIEELEAWFFGDFIALKAAFPRLPDSVRNKQPFLSPDLIEGGTWEALERQLQRSGYFSSGLRKVEVARELAQRVDPARNTSTSFQRFHSALIAALG